MIRPALLFAALLLVVGCGDASSPVGAEATVPPLHPSVDGYGAVRLEVGGTELAVLVADTPEERRHGLMEVEHLPDGVGMLFVYPEDHTGGFWMKDTLVPLSIAFVDADGLILEILAMEPCADARVDCPTYRPEHAYRYALEVPQGWFERVGVAESDRVSLLPR